jgi:hypothetical protein
MSDPPDLARQSGGAVGDVGRTLNPSAPNGPGVQTHDGDLRAASGDVSGIGVAPCAVTSHNPSWSLRFKAGIDRGY